MFKATLLRSSAEVARSMAVQIESDAKVITMLISALTFSHVAVMT